MSIQVVITMAGMGQRFRDAGYDLPKYMIPVRGKTLFAWAIESLNSFIAEKARFIFIARSADEATTFIQTECEQLGIQDYIVVEIDELTDGQATTAMFAAPHLTDKTSPFIIYNIDTHVDPNTLPFSAMRGGGWIPCFEGDGDGWSFVKTDAEGKAMEVREKKRISPHATIGLYGFSSFDLYHQAYETYYKNPEHLEMKERYIAPLYNQLIQDGKAVFIHSVPKLAVIPLGTPEEVEQFTHVIARS
ncbi:MAG: glycosyltransferase family 2 protein [Vampirovibrio sp.]|nr:glycosyltransferase family 2 protein [Vampirovibrio sp.]